MPRMTLTNESVTFTPEGVWIQPLNSDRFLWSGSVADFFNVLVYHPELPIETVAIRVVGPSLPAHGFGGHAVPGGDID